MNDKEKFSVYKKVTDAIIRAVIETDTLPWHKPWRGSDAPYNPIGKYYYRMSNIFLLNAIQMAEGFSRNYWGTYRQWTSKCFACNKAIPKERSKEPQCPFCGEKRASLKGAKSVAFTIFWKLLDIEQKDPDSGKLEDKKIPFLRYSPVFNIDQLSNMPKDAFPVKERPPFVPEDECETIIKRFTSAPSVKHGGTSAFYSPPKDQIGMPPKDDFDAPVYYYSTLFHEFVHSTGHADRLGRPEVMKTNFFGSPTYSQEELTAEMGASMLCAMAEIDNEDLFDNSVQYVQGWLKKLKDEPKWLITAASKAQKAVDYINPSDGEEEDDE